MFVRRFMSSKSRVSSGYNMELDCCTVFLSTSYSVAGASMSASS